MKLCLVALLVMGCSVDHISLEDPDAGAGPGLGRVDAIHSAPDAKRAEGPGKTSSVSDASSPEATMAPPRDTRPAEDLTAVVGQDTKPQVDTLRLDTLPVYVNTSGWSPDPSNLGACCLSCESNYEGCVLLVHTTPWCTVTVGGTCYQGGLADGRIKDSSVWPQCLPVKANGGCS
jgi:hypothetical protein